MAFNYKQLNYFSTKKALDINTFILIIVTSLFDGQQTGIPHSVGIYKELWVDKLYRGIERNYNGTFGFVCL